LDLLQILRAPVRVEIADFRRHCSRDSEIKMSSTDQHFDIISSLRVIVEVIYWHG